MSLKTELLNAITNGLEDLQKSQTVIEAIADDDKDRLCAAGFELLVITCSLKDQIADGLIELSCVAAQAPAGKKAEIIKELAASIK